MTYISKTIKIEHFPVLGKNCFRFEFMGELNEKFSQGACLAWEKEFEKANPTSKYTLVWDCLSMTGFDLASKTEWMETLNLLEDKIEKVIVIAKEPSIRDVVQMMLKLFAFETRLVKSYGDINLKRRRINNQLFNEGLSNFLIF